MTEASVGALSLIKSLENFPLIPLKSGPIFNSYFDEKNSPVQLSKTNGNMLNGNIQDFIVIFYFQSGLNLSQIWWFTFASIINMRFTDKIQFKFFLGIN